MDMEACVRRSEQKMSRQKGTYSSLVGCYYLTLSTLISLLYIPGLPSISGKTPSLESVSIRVRPFVCTETIQER